jgi:RNA polymerase sigma factor FliA
MATLALKAGGSEVAVRDLWRRHGEGDTAARERLILNYAPLVKVIAGRLHGRLPPYIEVDDLISAGLSGLLGAIERYDPLLGVPFKHFAQFRIRGAMIDALRSVDWVPRTVREQAREIEVAGASLRSRLGRPAGEEELAGKLELDLEELRQRLLQIDKSKIYSFDEPLGSLDADAPGASTLLDVEQSSIAGPQQALDEGDRISRQKERLAESIAELPQAQQFVLACRYQEDLRLGEIAEVMDLSESRISQLHTLALVNLKAAILGTKGRAEQLERTLR